MRISTTRSRGDCITCCQPTRMAPTKRSPGSVLVLGVDFQRRMVTNAVAASTTLSTNTAPAPTAARIAPATTGPTTRDRFIEMPFRAIAAPRSSRLTTSGTIAENTGQRIARPMPLAKVSTSSSGAVSESVSARVAKISAFTDTQACVAAK